MSAGIALRGGYAGLTSENPDERDWNKFQTIFSGDLLGNDGPAGSFQNYGDNSLHVVTINSSALITLEGLTITAGNAVMGFDELKGGGLLAHDANLLIDHCTFIQCSAYSGGGASVIDTTVTLQDSTFVQNLGRQAGGLEIRSSNVVIDRCNFQSNKSTLSVGGGAIAFLQSSGSKPPSTCSISDSDFISNRAEGSGLGGAIRQGGNSTLSLNRCNLVNNVGDVGGAIVGNPIAEDCIFVGNVAVQGGAAWASGRFTRCRFQDSFATFEGGGVKASASTFIQCTFADNVVKAHSGGAVYGSGTFINCELRGNSAWFDGGGAVHVAGGTNFVNCLITDNSSRDPGGAVRIDPNQRASFINTTITNNTSLTTTGGVSAGGNATIVNSVIHGNSNGDLAGNANVSYSCIGGGWPGTGNISSDPVFVDALVGDFRLQPGSLCIDAGDTTELPRDTFDLDDDGILKELLPLDLWNQKRSRNDPETVNSGNTGTTGLPAVDMGAFEFQPPVDINMDGIVNVNDLLSVINSWGPCAMPCPADIAPYPAGDGLVNFQDLLKVLLSWGQ